MSKSKATDTHLSSEIRARRLFLRLYSLFAIIIVSLVGFFYFSSQEQLMFSQQRIKMMEFASIQARKLKQLHRQYPRDKKYPRNDRFESAIYDLEYQKIFSTLKEDSVAFDEAIYNIADMIHLVKMLDDYYLGAKYLIIEIPLDKSWYGAIILNIAIYGSVALLLLMFTGLYLARLFVRPMRDSIVLLDRFIKDTTHELNTPLSAILTNIEMIDTDIIDTATAKKLNRIEIGARTVSTLYDDLKFLTLEQSKRAENENLDLLQIVKSRLEYFTLMIESKKIILKQELNPSCMYADRRLVVRVIDNLLSNAIKYNKRGGAISIVLQKNTLIIEDSGIGISREKLHRIFDRYSRFSGSEGGFGIGLNIVKVIVDQYDIDIKVQSELGVGTKVVLSWETTKGDK
ncbi:MAG: HAMP domain-containing histidine kinase [Sulfurovum sp.]|nr:HAMP domain-containing histidine kinase [Sulfurovum sp.]